jgi:pimeloyl-ACP methyl ester carboxylesterase
VENLTEIIANGIQTSVYSGGSGPPLVMLHGWAATNECWRLNIDELKRDYQVIAPDLPGHGRSEGGWRRYSLDFYVEWLHDLLDQCGAKKVILIGNSLGGAISIAFALKYPERVSHLVPVDALGFSGMVPFSTARLIALRLPYMIGIALNWRLTTSLMNYLKGMAFVNPWAMEEIVTEMARLNGKQGFWYIWSGLRLILVDFLLPRRRREFVQRLANISTPTMIVWGRHDGLLPVRDAFAGIKHMPASRLCIFEHSAHLPFLEEAENFNMILRAFLNSVT